MAKSTRSFEEEFGSRVKKGDINECWIWTGCADQRGRGFFGVGGRHQGVHRVAWELSYGSIQEGLCIAINVSIVYVAILTIYL